MTYRNASIGTANGWQSAYEPAAAGHRAYVTVRTPAPWTAPCEVRVLLIDADASDTQLVQRRMGETDKATFRLETAAGVAAAPGRLSRDDVDLVLLGSAASDGAVLDMLARLGQVARRIPVIVLVQGDSPDIAMEAVRGGAQDCLVKSEMTGRSLARAARCAMGRHQARESERCEHEALALAMRSMTEGLILTDASRRAIYCNGVIERLAGLSSDGILGNPLASLRWLGKEAEMSSRDRDALEGVLCGAASGPIAVDITIRQPVPRELTLTAFPIPVEAGQALLGILVHDVSKQRDAERRRDSFVSVASHELRTPMATIVGYSELLLTRDPAPETRKLWLERVLLDARRLSALVDDMLNVSRIHSGKVKIEARPLDLAPIVDELLESLRNTTDRHTLRAVMPAGLPAVMADREKLQQVLVNLVGNAIKYSPAGGAVTVSAASDPAKKHIIVDVKDEGVGIAKEDLDRLFLSFGRIRRPETEGIRGTGLGLYIVKALLGLMSGEISVESEPGRGSTFRFSLPAEETESLEVCAHEENPAG